MPASTRRSPTSANAWPSSDISLPRLRGESGGGWEPTPGARCIGAGGVPMSRRLIALLVVSFAALTACGRVSATQPAADGYRIFLEEGFNGGSERITVRDSSTGALERELPLGTPAPDWSRYYIVTPMAGSARLTAVDPNSGRTIAQATVPTGYALPSLGFQGPTAGLSPNGQWLALTDNGRATTGKLATSFLGGPSSLASSFKTVRLDGDFAFDALSDTGQSLYLIPRMGVPNPYQVRQ